jgi:hypothetical protein
MKLDDATQQKFPTFAKYIKVDFPPLTRNRPIIYGLKKWGKMSEQQARQYLIWGTPPLIGRGLHSEPHDSHHRISPSDQAANGDG